MNQKFDHDGFHLISEESMATVTLVPVHLFKMRCMFFFTVETQLCALLERGARKKRKEMKKLRKQKKAPQIN